MKASEITELKPGTMVKCRLWGEAFWVTPVLRLDNDVWRCRVENNLQMHPYKVGDVLDVTPDMWIDEAIEPTSPN